ncbi:hypothetical protein N9D59_08335 [Burkholderiaceae bacterium]|nr:hypothetical protein [Burkholderiaceae bacterium]
MTTKKRGRPLGKGTLENLRLEKMMREIPAYVLKLTADEKAQLEESFKHDEKIRLEILETYKHGSWTPDEHAYNMASLGHESFEGYEQQVLDDDDRYSRLAKKIRSNAGTEIRRKAEIRQDKVMEINKVVIEKIGNSDAYNIHRVAKMIHEQWRSMKSVHRFTTEDKNMQCRGDGDMPASVRTITRWLKQHLSNFDKPRR